MMTAFVTVKEVIENIKNWNAVDQLAGRKQMF
jgi:hypothetical protein